MKKLFRFLFIILISAFLIAACANPADDTGEKKTDNSEEINQDDPKEDEDDPNKEDPKEDNPVVTITVAGILVDEQPYQTEYNAALSDDVFAIGGLKVVYVYSNGSKKECTDYTLQWEDGTPAENGYLFTKEDVGKKRVNVLATVDGKEFKSFFEITVVYRGQVECNMTSPTKTSYVTGDSLDLTGLKAELTDSDGSIIDVTNECTFTFTDENSNLIDITAALQTGTYTLKVCYITTEGFEFTSWIYIIVQDSSDEPYTPDNPDEPDRPVYEDEPYISFSVTPFKKIFTAGENLYFDEISINYYSDINDEEPQKLTKDEWYVELYDGNEEKCDTFQSLAAGNYTVKVCYKDGEKVLTASYPIIVLNPVTIDEFKYDKEKDSISIHGFNGTEEPNLEELLNNSWYISDAPAYTPFASVPSDFEYEFIDGSTTEIRILKLKDDRADLVNEVTIPAEIDGYKVKEICSEAFYLYSKPDIRVLKIEKGVERFVDKETFYYSNGNSQFINYLKNLRELVLPEGFSLECTQWGKYDINAKRLESLTLPSDMEEIDFWILSYKMKKLVIPASVKRLKNCTFLLPELEEIVFEGQTDFDFYTNNSFIIPKVEEITFTGAVKYPPFTEVNVDLALKKIVLKAGLDAENAFANIPSLEEVVIESKEENLVIPEAAFANCSNLKTVTFVNDSENPIKNVEIGKNAFRNCSSLTKIELPEGASVNIEAYAFAACSDFESIHFSGYPLFIGEGAFYGLEKLTEISFPASTATINRDVYSTKDVVINKNAFYGVPGITEFTFEAKKSYQLYEESFAGLKLKNLYFNKDCDVTSYNYLFNAIGNPFDENTSLSSIDISNAKSVKLSFADMTSLQSLIVGDSECYSNFAGCSSLTDIQVGENGIFAPYSLKGCGMSEVTLQGDGDVVSQGLLKDCDNLTKVTFRDCTIPSYCFGKNGTSRKIELVFETVEEGCSIKDFAFYRCTGIENVDLEFDGAGSYIFAECSNLKEVTIRNTLESETAGAYMFKDCTKLEKVNYLYPGTEFEEDNGNTFYYSEINARGIFYNCESLKRIESNAIIYHFLTPYGFYKCSNLEYINLPSDNELHYSLDGNKLSLMLNTRSFWYCNKILPLFAENNLLDETGTYTFLECFQYTDYSVENYETNTLDVINGINAKNVKVTKKDFYYIPKEWAMGNVYIETVTIDGDIEARAFKGCSNLTTVTLGNRTFHAVKTDSFDNCPKLTKIIVPEEYYEQYIKSKIWKTYKDLICTE